MIPTEGIQKLDKAGGYRKYLMKNTAGEYGLTKEQLADVKNPVLVREIIRSPSRYGRVARYSAMSLIPLVHQGPCPKSRKRSVRVRT